MYHDMGLIGGILGGMQSGGHVTLFSAFRFLQRPLTWLEYISKYKVTHSGAPNFAYDLCVDRISPAERRHLDLSSWQCAFNGAETVRSETLDRFAEAFGPCGFRADAFYPCYGLAESTLMVTSRLPGERIARLSVPKRQLEQGRAEPASQPESDVITLVSSGSVVGGQRGAGRRSAIAAAAVRAGRVGEIWIQGPSVTGWLLEPGRSSAAKLCRRAGRRATPGPFLRSGDLGFFHGRQLFVTGRIKEVIIVRGRNHYPQDLEFTAQSSQPRSATQLRARRFPDQRDGRRAGGASAGGAHARRCGTIDTAGRHRRHPPGRTGRVRAPSGCRRTAAAGTKFPAPPAARSSVSTAASDTSTASSNSSSFGPRPDVAGPRGTTDPRPAPSNQPHLGLPDGRGFRLVVPPVAT